MNAWIYRACPAPKAPKRVSCWVNVYDNYWGPFNSTRAKALLYSTESRRALWKITFDKDTMLNPVIEVEGYDDSLMKKPEGETE